jgi:hypothetical protein
MKNLLFTFLVLLFSTNAFSQVAWEIDFENWYFGEDRVFIDTCTNPDNVWQVGQPSKTIFNQAFSIPNAILTDTLNYYPSNDTSMFIIKHRRDVGRPHGHTIILEFKYKINSDTLVDFGKIETSFDQGSTWIDLLDDDNIEYYDLEWWDGKPVLSGNIEEWQEKHLWLSCIDNYFEYNDTILYKFTFISDDIDNQKEGWLIDNIHLEDWWEGIESIHSTFYSTVIPNPIRNHGILRFENKKQFNSKIEIFNLNGQVIDVIETNTDEIDIYLLNLIHGVYFYKITNKSGNSYGKFMIN